MQAQAEVLQKYTGKKTLYHGTAHLSTVQGEFQAQLSSELQRWLKSLPLKKINPVSTKNILAHFPKINSLHDQV